MATGSKKITFKGRAILICVAVAFVLWLINALNKSYSVDMEYPVSIHYDTSKYSGLKPQPEKLRFNVTTTGWEVIKHARIFGRHPIQLDHTQFKNKRYITAQKLMPLVVKQIGGELKVNYMNTDTLFVELKAQRFQIRKP